MSNSWCRRWSRVAVLLTTAILILVAFPFNRSLVHTLLVHGRYPPLYPHHRQLELELPHYQSYEHSDVKYLWSPNHPYSMLSNAFPHDHADRHPRGRMGKYNARLHPKLCSRVCDQSLVSSLIGQVNRFLTPVPVLSLMIILGPLTTHHTHILMGSSFHLESP